MPSLDSLFNKFDMFGSSVPRMTIEGKSQVGTGVGFCITVFVAVIMTLFGSLQWFIIQTGANPQISISETTGAFISADDGLKLQEDFFFAFTVQHTISKKVLYDESLVRFIAVISEGDGIKQYQKKLEVGVHKCNATDFDKMSPPVSGSKHRINAMKDSDALFCFDQYDVRGKKIEPEFYGIDDNSAHRRIEFIFMPCLTYSNLNVTMGRPHHDHNIKCKGSLDNFMDIKLETE